MISAIPLVSDMGRLQVVYYLVLVCAILIGAALLMIGAAAPGVVRIAREPGRLALAALAGGALLLALVFALALAAAVAYGVYIGT